MKRSVVASFILIALARVCSPGAARAETPDVGAETRFGLGIQLDLFPTIASAAAGHFGYAPQLWFGIDHFRLRGVFAHLAPPAALAFADAGFENPTITVTAAMVDYTFGESTRTSTSIPGSGCTGRRTPRRSLWGSSTTIRRE